MTVTVNLNCSLSLRVLGKPSYSWRRNLIYLSETIAQSRSRKRDNLARERMRSGKGMEKKRKEELEKRITE